MSIEAMKQALEALETLDAGDTYKTHNAASAIRQAIEQAEKQEPVAWHEPGAYGNVTTYKDWALANGWEPLYAAPVHAIDISQERVDETAKRKDEPVAWHEPGAYGNVTTHKDWALANGWEPLYKEKSNGNTN